MKTLSGKKTVPSANWIQPSKPTKTKLYYLASPYSSDSNYIRELRYLQILTIGAKLTNLGYSLLEPIAGSHHHGQRFELPTGYTFWKTRDRTLIDKSDGVIVATLDGWKESEGVTDEIAYAINLGKPVYYLDPEGFLQ